MNAPITVASLLAALFLSACGPASEGTPAKLPDAEPTDGTAPIASGPAGAPAAASASAASAPASDTGTGELVAVANLPYEVRIFALDGALVTIAATPLADGSWVIPVGIIDGDRHIDKPEMAMKAVYAMPVAISGKWPGGVDLLVTGTTGRTSTAEHWTLDPNGGWRTKAQRVGAFYAGMADVSGSTLALEMHAMFPSFKPHIQTLRGPNVPRTLAGIDAECEKAMNAEGRPRAWFPKVNVAPQRFAGTRDGTLYSVGRTACGDEPALEVWAAGSATSSVVKLPRTPNQGAVWATTDVVRGNGQSDAIIIYGDVLLADGKNVRALPTLPNSVSCAAAGPSGTVYAITDEKRRNVPGKQSEVELPAELHRFDGTAWRKVALPAAPSSIATDRDGTVWVSAGGTLYRTPKKAGEKSAVAATKASAPAGNAAPSRKFFNTPRPAGPFCPSNLVVLYGFTKVTPDDYDFPLTRKALKGRTEYESARFVVAKDGGQKFFSAIVPDAKSGRRLVELIEKEVKGSKPQLLCAEPEIVRELKIDLKTGDVVK